MSKTQRSPKDDEKQLLHFDIIENSEGLFIRANGSLDIHDLMTTYFMIRNFLYNLEHKIKEKCQINPRENPTEGYQ